MNAFDVLCICVSVALSLATMPYFWRVRERVAPDRPEQITVGLLMLLLSGGAPAIVAHETYGWTIIVIQILAIGMLHFGRHAKVMHQLEPAE